MNPEAKAKLKEIVSPEMVDKLLIHGNLPIIEELQKLNKNLEKLTGDVVIQVAPSIKVPVDLTEITSLFERLVVSEERESKPIEITLEIT